MHPSLYYQWLYSVCSRRYFLARACCLIHTSLALGSKCHQVIEFFLVTLCQPPGTSKLSVNPNGCIVVYELFSLSWPISALI